MEKIVVKHRITILWSYQFIWSPEKTNISIWDVILIINNKASLKSTLPKFSRQKAKAAGWNPGWFSTYLKAITRLKIARGNCKRKQFLQLVASQIGPRKDAPHIEPKPKSKFGKDWNKPLLCFSMISEFITVARVIKTPRLCELLISRY